MKVLLNNLSYLVGTWAMGLFCFRYAMEKNWESCITWAVSMTMLWACEFYKEKADHMELMNAFIVGKHSDDMMKTFVESMAEFGMIGKNKTDGNGKEQK